MLRNKTLLWNDRNAGQLADVLTTIDDISMMQAFLSDVMTPKEIIEISARLEAARMLSGGAKYTDIIKTTRLSSRTVARISDWMKNGCGGYRSVLRQMAVHQHTPPARAD
jgi:TrpR-related protein YerC/YecD